MKPFYLVEFICELYYKYRVNLFVNSLAIRDITLDEMIGNVRMGNKNTRRHEYVRPKQMLVYVLLKKFMFPDLYSFARECQLERSGIYHAKRVIEKELRYEAVIREIYEIIAKRIKEEEKIFLSQTNPIELKKLLYG